MKAIDVKHVNSKPILLWRDMPDIDVKPTEVLVDIYSTAVNRADLAQAHGKYPPPSGESTILGLEMAGVVTSIGSRVKKWQKGDRVMALLGGGGYAENAAVHEEMLLPIPEGWSFNHAAALPEVWLTAYVNLFLEGKLAPNETVLIHAGASGVGTAAIQLAKSVGATVIVTAGSNSKQTACQELGADLAIDYKQEKFYDVIASWLDDQNVDLILDPVGGPYLEANVKLLGKFGRLVCIGLLGGSVGNLNMSRILTNRLRIIGSRLRDRPLTEKIEISHSFWDRFQPYFLTGALRPVIDIVYPIEEAQAAHEYVGNNSNIGKVILAVRD
jgi:putative PIG3 family NAD(P)H quinone oxidoreductase